MIRQNFNSSYNVNNNLTDSDKEKLIKFLEKELEKEIEQNNRGKDTMDVINGNGYRFSFVEDEDSKNMNYNSKESHQKADTNQEEFDWAEWSTLINQRLDSLDSTKVALENNIKEKEELINDVKSELAQLKAQVSYVNLKTTQTDEDLVKLNELLKELSKRLDDIASKFNSLEYLEELVEKTVEKVLKKQTEAKINENYPKHGTREVYDFIKAVF